MPSLYKKYTPRAVWVSAGPSGGVCCKVTPVKVNFNITLLQLVLVSVMYLFVMLLVIALLVFIEMVVDKLIFIITSHYNRLF